MRCFLIMDALHARPTAGNGQRSGVFFHALKELAPTEVIVIDGHGHPRPDLERHFPGHAGFHTVASAAFAPSPNRGWRWVLASLRRFTRVVRDYRADPVLTGRLRAIIDRAGPGPRVVVTRYLRTHCNTGLASDRAEGLHVLVDVDDRDDQRLRLAFTRLFGHLPVRLVVGPLVLRPVERLLGERLRAASLAWFAAAEDLPAGLGAPAPDIPAAVIRNVPYLSVPEDVAPAAAGRDVLFVGIPIFTPNREGVLWFLRQCWPRIRARHPQARLRLVGRGDWSAVAEAASDAEGVDVVGFVKDLEAEYARARLAICPVFEGGGSKIKLIEACAFARPVVATCHSARGFDAALSEALDQADDPAAFAGACCRHLADPDLATRTGTTLQALQRAHYSREAMEAAIRRDIRAACPEVAADA